MVSTEWLILLNSTNFVNVFNASVVIWSICNMEPELVGYQQFLFTKTTKCVTSSIIIESINRGEQQR